MLHSLRWNVSVNKALVKKAKALRLKKGLSQNFLVDDSYLQKIVDAVSQKPTALPIVEIGAGAGFLTEKLLRADYRVTAIEIDSKMIRQLQLLQQQYPQLQIIHQDVTTQDLDSLVAPRGIIVGNIPYHLTGPILFQITGELSNPDYPLRKHLEKAVLMVQKEVGERLTAKPGDSSYSQLTLQAQFWFQVTPLITIPKNAYYPSPQVDSMVIQLIPREIPAITVQDLAFFSRLIKQSFLHRRKTLLNNLKIAGFGTDTQLKLLLEQLNIPENYRPQSVSMEKFGALANALLANQ